MRLKHSNYVIAACVIGALLAIAGVLRGADPPEPTRNRLWTASAVAYAAAQGADMASSWGRLEANPLLRGAGGRFGGRGLAVKSVLAGAVIFGQWLILRKHPSLGQPLAFVNFGMAGGTGAVAARNWEAGR